MSNLSQPHLHSEARAYEFVEGVLWPHGPVCPRCGGLDRIGKLNGKSTRPGVYKCYECRKPFRVTVGTIFEKSHIPLHKWLQAVLLLCSSKKGFSARQFARILDLTPTSAWFMAHRLREAMREGALDALTGVVEVDETVYGRAATHPKGRQKYPTSMHKNIVLSLVERGGKVRSFHIENMSVSQIIPVVNANVSRETQLMTDKARYYANRLRDYASHDRVDHSKDEYVRHEEGRPAIHTNTIENVFSVFKRGMRGVYQHCKEKHLHRYLAEFDFRYNARSALGVEDLERAEKALRGVAGKRLTYRKARPGRAQQEGEQA
jgi:transposase-like protein